MVASLATACSGKPDTKTEASAPTTEVESGTEPGSQTEPETESGSQAEPETEPENRTEAESENQTEPVDESASEEFTLLDVSTDMIEAGVYAVSEDGTELVFSMFTEPSGTPMASLFIFSAEGEGDVICGSYTAESETDEDGIDWTLLTVSDAYTGGEFEIGFGESEEEVYIFDNEGTPYEGEYLTKDETIDYMGTAAALME